MSAPRIVSLLPAATEMACALGLEQNLVGVSHECDYPPAVRGKPAVMRAVVETASMTEAEIDWAVTERLRAGEPLYEVEAETLEALRPDLLLTQDLCEVCAASPKDLGAALAQMSRPPRVLRLTPKSLADIFANIADLGAATGRKAEARRLFDDLEGRVTAVADRVRQAEHRPRVFFMEWLDPIYCSGHWVPEVIELAGGIDGLGRKGTDSVRIAWDEVRAWAPEVLVAAPCGYPLDVAMQHAQMLTQLPGWAELPAVQAGRVFAVDAGAYYARPGPRVVDGLEIMAHLIHPELFDGTGDPAAFQRLRTKTCDACGSGFLCRPAAGCWCEAVAVAPEAAAAMQMRYSECLCPACLPGGGGVRASKSTMGSDGIA
jgi:iron complex transport system substrate-binding protein